MNPIYSYRALVQPICPRTNLANVAALEASQPCPNCRSVIPDRQKAENSIIQTDYELIDTFPEFPVLKESAKSGCSLCRILRKAIRQAWAVRPMEEEGVGPLTDGNGMWDDLFPKKWDGKVRIHRLTFRCVPVVDHRGQLAPGNGGDSSRVHGRLGGTITTMGLQFGPASTPPLGPDIPGEYGHISQTISFKIFDSLDLERGSDDTRRRLPSHQTLSPDNIKLMKRWINNCKENHAECATPASPWLPTRLVEISDLADSLSFRLVETATLSSSASPPMYAALSHMWGNTKVLAPLRTLKSNYKAMLGEIGSQDLPRNFIDALVVCAGLGIRYLWIDSLCIVQDDGEDWKREAGTMHLVYRYAEVTIVATSATSSRSGFLKRSIELIPAVKVRISKGLEENPPSPEPHSMILCPLNDVGTGLRPGDVESSQWNTRGWTMQERALSTRLIHFCQNKLYFECRSGLQSEEGEPEKHEAFQLVHLWPRSPVGPRHTSAEDSPLGAGKLYARWCWTVALYTGRNLTRGSDKLLAIQSVAAEMESQLGGGYIPYAGMWLGNLEVQLLWFVVEGIPSWPTEYRAPSWSWASLDARISFTKGDRSGLEVPECLRDCFRVLGCAETPTLRPPSPEDGRMRLRSWVRRVCEIRHIDDDDYWRSVNRASFPYDIFTSPTWPGESGGRSVVFAHGFLDRESRESPLTDKDGALLYVHVNSNQHPSGLLLREDQAKNQARSGDHHSAATWTRIGVATVFEMGLGPFVRSLFDEATLLEEVIIV